MISLSTIQNEEVETCVVNDLPLAIKLEDGIFQYDSIIPGPC